uniref:DNA helicase B n=1 Tax=Anas platyrhynchos platyrhynchos TaxID=8840 RepID=U3J342_ANAPP
MAAAGRGPAAELRGVLLPPRRDPRGSEDGDSEEEEEEEAEEELLLAEAALLEDAGREMAAALPPLVIQDNSKEEHEAVGRFPLVGPWWKVNVKVKKVGSKYFVQGYPSYFLRTDIEENNRQVFSLFLKECKVPDYFREQFFTWLPPECALSFGNLEEKLKQFQYSHPPTGKKQGDTKDFDILHYVLKSGRSVGLPKWNCLCYRLLVALTFPMILEFLPILLPRHFCCLLNMVNEMLTKLDAILKNEPWKLGFNRKITYRELKLSYCEATWEAFRQCERLLRQIPDLQKNALILYDKLKKRCREMGHTYEDQDELTNFVSKDMSIEHAWQSLEFLKDEKIVIREKKLVFLPHLYKSERDIAMYIGRLLSNCSWQLNVDARKILNTFETSGETADDEMNAVSAHEMEHLKEDNPGNHNCENPQMESTAGTQSKGEVDIDQVTAIEKICSNPVTIISGKGGCGKSTVVSCLFSHLKQVEKEVEAASKDFEGDLDASEEWGTFDHHSESENTGTKNCLNILLTAPTGRAASLLSEKTRLPAYTLHQIIYSFKSWRQTGQEFPWKFSTVTVLIVDEGSLVSVHVLSLVLKLLYEHAELAKLIILGDTRQLPSIDPGNVLLDIFESLKPRGFSVELRTNHRAESQLIVDNATRISQRKFPEFDEVLEVSGWNKALTMPRPEKKFIFIALPSGGGSDSKCVHSVCDLDLPFCKAKTVWLELTFLGDFNCDLINELCCQHYSKHLTRDHKRRLLFQIDDKISCTRNTYLKDLLPGHGFGKEPDQKEDHKCRNGETTLSSATAEDGKRLCNGDIFFITDVSCC